MRIDHRAHPPGRLLQQQRELQRRADLAHELEQKAVAAVEPDRQNSGLMVDDQPSSERMPRRVVGLAEDAARGGDSLRWKDDETTAGPVRIFMPVYARGSRN
jgi:hypothetical protein